MGLSGENYHKSITETNLRFFAGASWQRIFLSGYKRLGSMCDSNLFVLFVLVAVSNERIFQCALIEGVVYFLHLYLPCSNTAILPISCIKAVDDTVISCLANSEESITRR